MNTNTVYNQINDVLIALDSVDGTIIAKSNIFDFALFEDLFTLLPSARFNLKDAAGDVHDNTLYIGQTVYIMYKPVKAFNTGDSATKYIAVKMKIIQLSVISMLNSQQTVMHVECCYDALPVLSKVQPYPPKLATPTVTKVKESSAAALRSILAAGGLDAHAEIATNDSMTWINTRNKIYECANKIIEHISRSESVV